METFHSSCFPSFPSICAKLTVSSLLVHAVGVASNVAYLFQYESIFKIVINYF